MSLPMPTCVEDIARVVVAADDAYAEHLAVCQDSPCLNCDTLAGLFADAISALREALNPPRRFAPGIPSLTDADYDRLTPPGFNEETP